MLEDTRLKIFKMVVQNGSFTKAAQSLGITQPSVSQNVADLEKGLGVKLFDRLRGEVVLTDQGKVFLSYVERLSKVNHDIETLFSQIPDTIVRIAASEEIYTYYISPRLSEFVQVHRNVRFERALFEDADLTFVLRPQSGSIFDEDPDILTKVRISLSPVATEKGDINATHENTSYFEILFKPSDTFSCTKLCRLLKEFLK